MTCSRFEVMVGRGYSSAVDLGIDFGTTRTVVAYADRGNYPVVSFDDEAGDSFDWFPSVVAARGEELAFGWSAIAVEGDPAWTQARSFKRLLAGARADGEVDLGGERFGVAALVARFLEALHHALRTGDHARGRLLQHCRELKERLNPSSRKITVDLEAALGSAAPVAEIAIAVDDYYAAVAPLVERTIDAMAPVIDRLAGEVPRGPEDDPLGEVAGVYVVGGASALPLVGRMLRARFGRRVHRSPYPHAAIAIGLAIAAEGAAHGGSGYALSDRFSRNFGVFRESEGGAAATYDPIFTRETPLPAPGAKVSVARRYRAAHDVGHYRFFECSSFDDGGAPRGDIAPTTDVLFAFDPALRAGGVDLATWPVRRLAQRGPLVEERYEVDAHGIVELTITDLESGFAKTQTLGARVA